MEGSLLWKPNIEAYYWSLLWKKLGGKILRWKFFFRKKSLSKKCLIFLKKNFDKKIPPDPPTHSLLPIIRAQRIIWAYICLQAYKKRLNILEKSLTSLQTWTHDLPVWSLVLYQLSYLDNWFMQWNLCSYSMEAIALGLCLSFKYSHLPFNFNLWYWNHKDGNRKSCIFLSK